MIKNKHDQTGWHQHRVTTKTILEVHGDQTHFWIADRTNQKSEPRFGSQYPLATELDPREFHLYLHGYILQPVPLWNAHFYNSKYCKILHLLYCLGMPPCCSVGIDMVHMLRYAAHAATCSMLQCMQMLHYLYALCCNICFHKMLHHGAYAAMCWTWWEYCNMMRMPEYVWICCTCCKKQHVLIRFCKVSQRLHMFGYAAICCLCFAYAAIRCHSVLHILQYCSMYAAHPTILQHIEGCETYGFMRSAKPNIDTDRHGQR